MQSISVATTAQIHGGTACAQGFNIQSGERIGRLNFNDRACDTGA